MPTTDTAQMNGAMNEKIDPDDLEYQMHLRRPAEIKEDVAQMQNRSRVKNILDCRPFRSQLEEILDQQVDTGPHGGSFIGLSGMRPFSEMLTPKSRIGPLAAAAPVIPINDVRGVDSLGYNKWEKIMRCKLASCYRLIDLFNWSHGIYNHISFRLTQDQEHFLINPFGLMYHEITATTLVKVNMQGEILDPGTTSFGINKAGFILHSAIHQARPDIKCIIHLHTPAAVAVSIMKCGLLPISQEAILIGGVSYHDYRGILVDDREKDDLARNLGPTNKVMFLRNHGLVACGETIEEAFHYAANCMRACETQIRVAPSIGGDLVGATDEAVKKARDDSEKQMTEEERKMNQCQRSALRMKTGELEYAALMRHLDNAGFRTGYLYTLSTKAGEGDASSPGTERKLIQLNDIAIPPAAIGHSWDIDDIEYDEKYGSPARAAVAALARSRSQPGRRQNLAYYTPNVYQKVSGDQVDGTAVKPKQVARWASINEPEVGPASPVKPAAAVVPSANVSQPKYYNKFVPLSQNPREFKLAQQKIRKEYLDDHVHAGPQSRILEGGSWTSTSPGFHRAGAGLAAVRAGNIGTATESSVTSDSEAVDSAAEGPPGSTMSGGERIPYIPPASPPPDSVVVVGAASKGIINRKHQNDVHVYKTGFGSNPFAKVNEEELSSYRPDAESSKSKSETGSSVIGPPLAESSVIPEMPEEPSTVVQTDVVRVATIDQPQPMLVPSSAATGKREPIPQQHPPSAHVQQPSQHPAIRSDEEETTTATETDVADDGTPAHGGGRRKKKKKGLFASFGKGRKKETAL